MRNIFKNKKKKVQKTSTSNSAKFVEAMIKDKPDSQKTEILYELMKHYKSGQTRLELMNSTGVLNVPVCIGLLRKDGVLINTNRVDWVNRYGRKTNYGSYQLKDFKNAVEIYEKLIEVKDDKK